jgi:O-antigen/teichoic acid export membrane protein
MGIRKDKAFNGAITSFIQYGLIIVLQVLLSPTILREAGQEVLGAFSVLMQIIGYGILLDLGFFIAFSRYLTQSYHVSYSDGASKFKEVFAIGRVFLVIMSLVFSLLIYIVACNISIFIGHSNEIDIEARNALYCLAIWTILKTPIALYNHLLLATQNMVASNLITIVGNILRLILSLVLVHAGYGLFGLIASIIISEFIAYSIQAIYFKRKYPNLIFGWKFSDIDLLKEMLTFGAKYWGVNLSAVLYLGSDSLIVGSLYGVVAASIFYSTKIPAFLLYQFIFKISDNSSPAINELFSVGNIEAVKQAYFKILRYSLLMALPLGIGIIVFNESVISLWLGKAQYAGDVMSFAIAIFVFTQVVNHTNAMIIIASGELKYWTSFSILTSALSFILAYLLGKMFGMQWVMVAVTIMDIPNIIFSFKRVFLVLNISFDQIWRYVFISVTRLCIPLIALAVYIKMEVPLNNSLSIVCLIMLFSSLWAFFLISIGLNKSERFFLVQKCRFYQ